MSVLTTVNNNCKQGSFTLGYISERKMEGQILRLTWSFARRAGVVRLGRDSLQATKLCQIWSLLGGILVLFEL